MPHHNRAILADIAENDLDPTVDYVTGKDGLLKLKPKDARNLKVDQKEEEKPVSKSKEAKKPTVVTTELEVLPEVKPEPAIEVVEVPSAAEVVEQAADSAAAAIDEEIKDAQKKKLKVKKPKDLF